MSYAHSMSAYDVLEIVLSGAMTYVQVVLPSLKCLLRDFA